VTISSRFVSRALECGLCWSSSCVTR